MGQAPAQSPGYYAARMAVIVLSVLEGYSEREVAEALGVPAGTVKSRLSRAKARLREDLSSLEGARA